MSRAYCGRDLGFGVDGQFTRLVAVRSYQHGSRLNEFDLTPRDDSGRLKNQAL